MQRFFLMLARFALSAWIGAAALFVCTSISEQISPTFDSDIKNTLAAIRFPWYYGFGFALVGMGFVGSLIGVQRTNQKCRWSVIIASLVLALLLMVFDYVSIYTPLHEIVTSPSAVRDARFVELHRWSERINTIDILLCLIASLTLCWPSKPLLTSDL